MTFNYYYTTGRPSGVTCNQAPVHCENGAVNIQPASRDAPEVIICQTAGDRQPFEMSRIICTPGIEDAPWTVGRLATLDRHTIRLAGLTSDRDSGFDDQALLVVGAARQFNHIARH